MKVSMNFDLSKGEPIEVQVYPMKIIGTGDAMLCDAAQAPDFFDIAVRGEPDAGGEIHVFLEYDNLPDQVTLDYCLGAIERIFPGLPVEYVAA